MLANRPTILFALLAAALPLAKPAGAWIHGASTLGLAANRTDMPVGVSSIAANNTCRREHFSHPDGALSAIQTVDVGWFLSPVPTTADAYTIKRYIEYPANTFTQITWGGGATSVTIGSGAVVKSDLVPISIPAGAEFWERTVNLNATVTNYPIIQLPSLATNLGVDDGCDAADKGNTGTIAAGGSNFTGAAAIMGTINKANARGFVFVGDSICFGFGVDTGIGAKGGSGFLARATDVHGYPYARLCASSWSAQNLASNLTLPAAFYAQIFFTDVIQQLGSNDLANLSRTQAQLLADHQAIYGLFPGKRIYQTTITSRTTSTDSWATTANQTISTVGTMSLLNGINTAIRAGVANVSAVLDVADAQMTARDSDIWATPPTPTLDGTHPNTTSHAAIAAAIAPGL